jgi:hypothetical protein
MAEETVNVNPDGSTTFEGSGDAGSSEESTMPPVDGGGFDEETMNDVVTKGTDPAIYLLMAVVLIGFLYFLYTRKARADQEDEFFVTLEDEKVCVCVCVCALRRVDIVVREEKNRIIVVV